jgi:hypothetical protein
MASSFAIPWRQKKDRSETLPPRCRDRSPSEIRGAVLTAVSSPPEGVSPLPQCLGLKLHALHDHPRVLQAARLALDSDPHRQFCLAPYLLRAVSTEASKGDHLDPPFRDRSPAFGATSCWCQHHSPPRFRCSVCIFGLTELFAIQEKKLQKMSNRSLRSREQLSSRMVASDFFSATLFSAVRIS